MSVTEARSHMRELWQLIKSEPVAIEADGKPIAIVLSPDAFNLLSQPHLPREPGCGRHLISEAGVNVDALLATSVQDVFEDYLIEAD